MRNSRVYKNNKDCFDLSFDDFNSLVVSDDYFLWEKHLELRERFEKDDTDPLYSLQIASIQDAKMKGYEVVSRVLGEFLNQKKEIIFSPSHGAGHAMRDYLHALVLAEYDADPREAYVRVVAGALHDILGCSLIERFDEDRRSIRHAEASALVFWWLSRRIGIDEKDTLPIYYALAAHTNYLEGVDVKDDEGRVRKIRPYKKCHDDGRPIYFLHGVQEVDRLDIVGPCGFFRYYLSVADSLGKEYYYGPMGKFSPVSFSKHMRPVLRPDNEIGKDSSGATMRELITSMANTQENNSIYARWDGVKMIEMRDAYNKMTRRILDAFDTSLSLSFSEKEIFFTDLNEFIVDRIEPTEEARNTVAHLQKLFFSLPVEVQGVWFSVLKASLEEYRKWLDAFKVEIAGIPDGIFSLPVLGRGDRIVR